MPGSRSGDVKKNISYFSALGERLPAGAGSDRAAVEKVLHFWAVGFPKVPLGALRGLSRSRLGRNRAGAKPDRNRHGLSEAPLGETPGSGS